MIKSTVHSVCGIKLAGEREDAYFLDDGTEVTVTTDLQGELPLGEPLWLDITDGEVVGYLHSPDTYAAAQERERKELKVALLRCVREDKLDDADFLREELRKASLAAAHVQNFWRSKGWRFWQFECRPFILPIQEGERLPDKGVWCEDAIARLKEADPKFAEYDPFYFHLWGNVSGSYCGWGQRPGKYSMTFAACGWRTMCHEVGHNFGLHHSNGADDEEYGNTACVMGRGFSLSAAQTLKLPLNTEREWFRLNKSRRFLMAPIEGNEYDLHPNMYQAARFARGGREYVIGFHRTKNAYELTVELDAKKPNMLNRMRKPGSTFTVEDVTITLEENQGGYAQVNVDFGDGLGNQDTSLPPYLPEAVAPNEPGPEHTGVWWNPLLNGQGFDIRDNQINWYTYNPRKFNLQNKVSQRWFKGAIEGNYVTLYTGSESGNGLRECGFGRLSFLTPDKGIFQYHLNEPAFAEKHRRGSVWIERVMNSNADLGGLKILADGTWESTHVVGEDKTVKFTTGFGPRPLDHIYREIRGEALNQQWKLEVGGRVVRPHNGLFMEQVLPEYEED